MLTSYHRALWNLNVALDVVPVTTDLDGYDVVVAPLLHLVKGDLPSRLRALVERGGTLLTTFLSARVDEDDNAFLTDAPGPLRDLLGLRVEETDAQQPSVVNPVTLDGVVHEARHVFEIVVPDEATTVVATYGADFYAGSPAVTRATRGRGEAWYVATALDDAGVADVVRRVVDRHGLVGPHADTEGVEVADRVSPEGVLHRFVLHHGADPVTVTSEVSGTDLLTGRSIELGQPLTLSPTEVLVLS